LIWILLGLVALLIVVAVGSVAGYLLLSDRPDEAADAWQDPVAGIVPEEVAPDIALYPLAGASDVDTIDLAIDNGQPYTAYAALLQTLDLPDAQRSGRLLDLADRFQQAGNPEMARLALQQAYDIAVLSPELSDPQRADALLSIGRGWAGLKEDERAMTAYDQAYVVALDSPFLQTAFRRELLSSLVTACSELGRDEQAAQCRQQLALMDQRAQPQPPAAAEDPIGLFGSQEPVSSEEIGKLEETRRQAALAVLKSVSEGQQLDQGLAGALSQALQAEDQAKLALYNQELQATTQPGGRASIHWAQLRWLMMKSKVAGKSFGLSLVPAWEAQAAEIRSELSKAYEALRFDYEDIVTSLPDAALMEPGRYEIWRWLLLAGRLGQYPNYGEGQLAGKLQEAAQKQIASGAQAPLYVDVRSEEQGLHYFLSSAAGYGQTAGIP
jgi:hypothetical protein